MKLNTSDFNARGDGITDDRASIQAALNAASPGDTVELGSVLGERSAPITFLVGNFNASSCLNIPAGIRLVGKPGSSMPRLLAAPGIPGGVRIIDINAPDVEVANLVLDGNATNQPTPNEHMHGLMTRGARTRIVGVTALNNCGDGLYAYTGADALVVQGCLSIGNRRNGITLSGTWNRGLINGNEFTDNAAQQLDSEASVITELRVISNKISKVGATDHLVTVSGLDKDHRSSRWAIFNNMIDGGIHVAWADDIVIESNTSQNMSIRPCVSVYRTCKRVKIKSNKFCMSQTTDATTGVITVSGTAEGGPERVLIEDNRLAAMGHPHSFGVRVEGAVSVQVLNNRIDGPALAAVAATPGVPGSAGGAGVYARATSPDRKFESMAVIGNRIQDFGQFGVSIMGNGAAELTRLDVINNVFDNGEGTMTTGISLDPCAKDVRIGDNVLLGGCMTEVVAPPTVGIQPNPSPMRRWLAP